MFVGNDERQMPSRQHLRAVQLEADPQEIDRFSSRDNRDLHRFPTDPSNEVKDDFLRHVKEDGRPDLYKWHVHTKPLSDRAPRIITPFAVPERLRIRVGMAPCPLCSLRGPKYFSGFLVWFEDEHCVRAIGHECGHDFFDGGSFAQEQRRFTEARMDDIALDKIIEGLPLVRPVRRFIAQMQPKGRECDRLRRSIFKALGSKDRKALLRLSSGTPLRFVLAEERVIRNRFGDVVTDEEGVALTKLQESRNYEFLLHGNLVFAEPDELAENLLYGAEQAMASLADTQEDEVLDWTPGERLDAAKGLSSARGNIVRALNICNEVHAFVDRGNVERLLAWGHGFNTPVRLRGEYVGPNHFYLAGKQGDLHRITFTDDANKRYAAPQFILDWHASDQELA